MEPWDKEPETEQNIDAFVKGCRLVTSASFHVVAIYVPLAMVGMVRKVLSANNYSYIQELVWFKPNHNLSGASFSLIPSVGEVILIGLSSAEQKVLDRNWIRLSKNPLDRPNMIVAPTCAKRKRDDAGRVINSHEKPSCIMSYLVPMFCVEGAKVVVAGAGAMGDALGVVSAGYDCITFENDGDQIREMIPFLAKHKLVNESKLVIPFEALNRRLTLDAGDSDVPVEASTCDLCGNELKNEKDGGLCNFCKEKYICEKCFGGFGLELPKCRSCAPVLEVENSAIPAKSASEASEKPSD